MNLDKERSQMKSEQKIYAVISMICVLIIVFCLLPSRHDQETLGYPLPKDPIIELDPVINDIDLRVLLYERYRPFSFRYTPIDNMGLVLQSLDSFYLCDEDWLKEMQYCVSYLKQQYRMHRNSLDPHIQELMVLQRDMIEAMDLLIRETDSDQVDKLRTAFKEYQEYYETKINEEGDMEDGEETD